MRRLSSLLGVVIAAAFFFVCVPFALAVPDVPIRVSPDDLVTVATFPVFTMTLADASTTNQLAYRIEIKTDLDVLVVSYTDPASDSSADRTYTLGQSVVGDKYDTGHSGMTLGAGIYFWRLRAEGPSGNSEYTTYRKFTYSPSVPEFSTWLLLTTAMVGLGLAWKFLPLRSVLAIEK